MNALTPVSDRVTCADLFEGTWSERFATLAQLPVNEPVRAELHPALVGLLAAPEPEQRAEAIAAAVRAGARIVPLLLAVLTDEGAEVDTQRAAVRVLGELGPSAHAAAWVLADLVDDPALSACARTALLAVEPPPRTNVPLLCVVLAVIGVVLCFALGL